MVSSVVNAKQPETVAGTVRRGERGQGAEEMSLTADNTNDLNESGSCLQTKVTGMGPDNGT